VAELPCGGGRPNGQLIVNLIPEVEYLIGKQAPVQTCCQTRRSTLQTVLHGSQRVCRTGSSLALFSMTCNGGRGHA